MTSPVSIKEAVQLGAVDGAFYSQFFFPKTCRQATPDFHREIWASLDDPTLRYVGVEVFRDGAKTSLLRLYTSRRVAYGISHTICYVSHSEAHAVRSVSWLRKQIEFNRFWSETFGLRPGGKWKDGELEIIHGVDEYPISVLAVGITGQVRGINFDDYRPDLVVADDVDDEETTATKEQREKASGLFFGSLIQGLASPVDQPLAKAVLLATPLNNEDLIHQCKLDSGWKTFTFSCFDRQGESVWPQKFPTDFLQKEKQSYISRGQLNVWMREKECKIVSSELASFKLEWLKYFEVEPEGLWHRIIIDPAQSDSKNADEFAIVVLGFQGRKRFLCEYHLARGVMPDEAVSRLFTLIKRYNVRDLVVETVAYQKILQWYIAKEMQRQRMYRPIHEFDDRRSKADRILQGILSCAPYGDLFVKATQTEFLSYYGTWSPHWKGLMDLLDATAMGLCVDAYLDGEELEGEFERLKEEEKKLPELEFASCP